MTDVPNARHNSPCCKDAGMRKEEYDYLEVEIDEEEHHYETHIPVFTCKECGKKWAIERVAEKVDFDEIREIQRIQEEIMNSLQSGNESPKELYEKLDCRRNHFKDAVKVLDIEGKIESNLDRELEAVQNG